MALTTTPQANPLGATLVTQTTATAAADDDLFTGAATLHMVDIDNAANVAAVYVKLFNNTNPTVGTTAADAVYMCPGSVRRVFPVPSGVAYSVGISIACVTGALEADTTSPGNPVVVRLLAT